LLQFLKIKQKKLRIFLKDRLPDYMIPSAFIPLEKFPRLPNGKINRNNLPSPNEFIQTEKNNFVAPETATEKQLVQIWEAVLKIPTIGIHDNYFDIGGDSIRSIQVIAKARKAGIELAPHHLFEHQTIADLSHFLETEKEKSLSKSLVLLNKKVDQPPLFCVHSGGGHVFFYQPLAKILNNERTLYALQPEEIDTQSSLPKSIVDMATFYIQEMKKAQPTGPYHLLGTCFSNAVVLEMAHQLMQKKEEIEIYHFPS